MTNYVKLRSRGSVGVFEDAAAVPADAAGGAAKPAAAGHGAAADWTKQPRPLAAHHRKPGGVCPDDERTGRFGPKKNFKLYLSN